MPRFRRFKSLALALLLACEGGPADPDTPAVCAGGGAATEGCVPVLPPLPCPSGSMALPGQAECVPAGWSSCPEGFEREPAGWGCVAIEPEAPCPAGTRPALGSRECVPVGMRSCPEGFAPRDSGWGCRAILPEETCAGALRQALGETACVPVGDCARPFPPAGALIVDASLPPEKLDATHFATVGAALAKAPEGATVAVESGVYPERLVIARSVTIVGRCAERVVIRGSGAGSGVSVRSLPGRAARVALEGLTLENHAPGVLAEGAAELSLAEVVIERSRGQGVLARARDGASPRVSLARAVVRATGGASAAAVAAEEGARLDVAESDLSDNLGRAVQSAGTSLGAGPSRVEVSRSVLRKTAIEAGNRFGLAAHAFGSGVVSFEESALVGNEGMGVVARDPGSSVSLRRSVLEQSSDLSRGGQADDGASITAEDSTLVVDQGVGLAGFDSGSELVVSRSTLLGARACPVSELCGGLVAGMGADLVAEDVALFASPSDGVVVGDGPSTARLSRLLVDSPIGAIEDAEATGVQAQAGGRIFLSDSAVVRVSRTGISAIEDALVEAERVLVNSAGVVGGVGEASGVQAQQGATMSLTQVSIRDTAGTGVQVMGAGFVTRVSARQLAVVGGRPGAGVGAGRGVEAADSELELEDALLLDNRDASLLLFSSAAKISRLSVARTGPTEKGGKGVAVYVDGGSRLTLSESALVDSLQVGLIASGPASISSTVIKGVGREKSSGNSGHCVASLYAPSTRIERCQLSGCEGIGLLAAGSPTVLAESLVEGNAVGIHAQDELQVTVHEKAPPQVLPHRLAVDQATIFRGNVATQGSGIVALPDVPGM